MQYERADSVRLCDAVHNGKSNHKSFDFGVESGLALCTLSHGPKETFDIRMRNYRLDSVIPIIYERQPAQH